MFVKPALSAVLAAAVTAAVLTLVTSPARAGDEVAASFERMLAPHEGVAARAAVAPGPADPLLAAVVVPLRDGVWPAAPVDPVLASFTRLLSHAPNRVAPAVPAGEPADPLIAAVVQPLLRGQQIAVAGRAVRAGL